MVGLCWNCGWITLFRRWPGRLRRFTRYGKPKGCAKCHEGPVERIPPFPERVAGLDQLILAVKKFAASSYTHSDKVDDLVQRVEHGHRLLLVREAVRDGQAEEFEAEFPWVRRAAWQAQKHLYRKRTTEAKKRIRELLPARKARHQHQHIQEVLAACQRDSRAPIVKYDDTDGLVVSAEAKRGDLLMLYVFGGVEEAYQVVKQGGLYFHRHFP